MQKGFKNDFEVTREIECEIEIHGRWATKFATQGKRLLVVMDWIGLDLLSGMVFPPH